MCAAWGSTDAVLWLPRGCPSRGAALRVLQWALLWEG